MLKKSIAVTLRAVVCLAAGSMMFAPAPMRAETEIIEHNASVVVNGWKLKADEIVRKSNGVVKAIGNAHASNPDHHCSGSADKIVLSTGARHISFYGDPHVDLDGTVHTVRGAGGLQVNYATHEISPVED